MELVEDTILVFNSAQQVGILGDECSTAIGRQWGKHM
jgi:hypothetical protein